MNFSAYRDHPLHATLRRILELRAMAALSIGSVTADEGHVYSRNKVFAVASALDELIRSTPEELVSIAGLHAINTHLQQALSELTSFGMDENPVRLDNASSSMDSVLASLWAFTPKAQPVLLDALPSLLKNQQHFALESLNRITDENNVLSEHLNALTVEAVNLRSKFDEMSEAAARDRAEATAAIAKLEQIFHQAEGVRQLNFDDTVRIHREKYSEELNLQSYSASKTLASLDAYKDQAAKIVQVVGNIGATGNYKRIADTEEKLANVWRRITLGIFAIGIAVAGATFYKFWGETFTGDNAVSILIRLLYAIVITTPAWYSAKESARHRSNADRARLTELELASIGPFIELLPEDKKIEIRTSLTALYFGRGVEAHTATPPLDADTLKSLVIDVLKAAKS